MYQILQPEKVKFSVDIKKSSVFVKITGKVIAVRI